MINLNLFGSRAGSKLFALTDVAKTAPGNTYGGAVTLFLALDDKNGQLLWQLPVNEGLSLAILAQEYNGMFYLALERQDQPQAQLMAVSVSNGQPLWQQRYPGQGLMSVQPNGTMLSVRCCMLRCIITRCWPSMALLVSFAGKPVLLTLSEI